MSKGNAEIDAVSPFFKMNLYRNNQATKSLFLEKYEKNTLIHISTHAGIEKGHPWLAFYDEKMLLDELPFLSTKKNLVVLSACETSVGEYKRGEGVFSIARSFIRSGAGSVVSTLWKVNEKSNAEIISTFYENLLDGQSKSKALHNAKLSYIQNHQYTSQISPYYWSSVILTGSTTPIKTNQLKVPWSIIVPSLLLGLVLLVLFFMG